jgi:UPF0716 protein FxsA
MFGRVLLLTVLCLPILEIGTFILVGQAIGPGWALLGIVAGAVAGAMVIRHQGAAALRQMRDTVGRGQLPAQKLADAVLVAVAGLLLMLPGFLTDVLGILLLVAPVRQAIYAVLAKSFVVVPAEAARPREPGVIDLDGESWRER